MTRVNRGKGHFQSWSMNVKFEGKNVVRHQDMISHNSASEPGNTPPWAYKDKEIPKPRVCAAMRNEAKKKCEPKGKDRKEFEKEQERRNERIKAHNRKIKGKKGKKQQKPIRAMGWKDKHCTGLMRVKPFSGLGDAKATMEKMMDQIQDTMANLDDILIEKGLEIAAEKAKKVAARAGAKYAASLFGGPLAPVLGAISTAVTVVDGAYSTVTGAMEAYDVYKDIESQLEPLKNALSSAKKRMAEVERGMDLLQKEKNGTLSKRQEKELAEIRKRIETDAKEMTDAMVKQADTNPCLKALKCNLTPYGKPTEPMALDKNTQPNLKGCCPGQTGHHLPPATYFKNCDSYVHKKALVVCVEGKNQYQGSHGEIHDLQDTFAKAGLKDGELSFDEAIESAVKSHKKLFPHCTEECTREQLKRSLKKCKNSKINAVTKSRGALQTDVGELEIPGN